jgi:hypothetical protein
MKPIRICARKNSLPRKPRQYIGHLKVNYSLRKILKKIRHIRPDDLYYVLYAHWVLHDSVFRDDHQRLMVATGILASVYFGCRSVSLFDTGIKLDDPGNN